MTDDFPDLQQAKKMSDAFHAIRAILSEHFAHPFEDPDLQDKIGLVLDVMPRTMRWSFTNMANEVQDKDRMNHDKALRQAQTLLEELRKLVPYARDPSNVYLHSRTLSRAMALIAVSFQEATLYGVRFRAKMHPDGRLEVRTSET